MRLSWFPSIMDSAFFASFIGNAVFDMPNERRRFQGSRLKFCLVLSLGFDAESFYVKLREHLKQKGFDVNLFAISVPPVFWPLENLHRVCGLLELDKQVDTYCSLYFSPASFTVLYSGFGALRLPLLSHLTSLIIKNQTNGYLSGWLSNEQTLQLIWASAVTYLLFYSIDNK